MLKKLLLSAAALACAGLPMAHAFTYSDGNLLLVFRQTGLPDVIYNLGSVSNYLGKANGAVLTNSYDPTVALNNFGGSLSGSQVILMATTPTSGNLTDNQVWLTDANLGWPSQEFYGDWSAQASQIRQVGGRAVANAGTNTVYVVSSTSSSSYTVINSQGPQNSGLPKLGGTTPFVVEGTIETTLRFFQIGATTTYPYPPATQIGTFAVYADGTLVFTAGQQTPAYIAVPPFTTTVNLNGSTNFTVVPGGTSPTIQWFKDGNLINGQMGTTLPLNHVAAGDAGNYSVRVFNSGGDQTSTPVALRVLIPPGVVSGPTFQSGQAQMTVPNSVVGLNYSLLAATNLAKPILWQPVATQPGTGGTIVLTDPAPTPKQTFYRVQVQ